ncbi:methyltransferase domain-containing protein [Roseivirga sp. BDSF3-8]|uniref:class I SAM-dependent methyltransferase n=1 Tax=Roseivirga sp. BDSF3-8 TaxID=3241598 RepID=UPI003532761B
MTSNEWLDKWNERYSQEGYAYGTAPNAFFKEQLQKLKPGKLLLPAEGEGRNAVFAAANGWKVEAFDISEAGRHKAYSLANEHGVKLNYTVGPLPELDFTPGYFDAIGLIYAHFPADIREKYHQVLQGYLKEGGVVILEAFGSDHLRYRDKNPAIGGPDKPEALLSVEEIQRDFKGFDIQLLCEKEVELSEGKYHIGTGSVVRFIGRKKVKNA